jgi:hypothetical protein
VKRYRIEGQCVIDREDGLAVYDELSHDDAVVICRLLNEGLGPAWDDIVDEVDRARKARAKKKTPPRR